MNTKAIKLSELSAKIDPITAMRENWFLLTAKNNETVNTLTIGWGALGNVWEKKTITVYIRPQRHTKKFMDESGYFSATFFDGKQQEMIYPGSNSGADVPDKIEKSGLHLNEVDNQPTFIEGKMVLICKILYKQKMKQECFIDSSLAKENYPSDDYSYMYIAEI